jgi:NAD(P)-dependent dehydrogenase (short-subunit alcohol dehydrogenase family)
MLDSPAACQRYITTHAPSHIALQLRSDQTRCKDGRLPSLLALSLPKPPSRLADDISLQLLEEKDRYGVPTSIRHLRYNSIISAIKAHLEQLGQNTNDEFPIKNTIPSTADFAAALKVLEYLETHPGTALLKPASQLPDIITAVRTQLSLPPELRAAYRSSSRSPGKRRKRRKCYMCHLLMSEPHEFYPSLCKPCGTFNLAESNLSLPGSLNLDGKTALVTGGRVALGYATAIRLLRCGARVIVSSRYPRDAESRYREEHDFDSWSDRLRVVGADFRTARDVFRLVGLAKKILAEWGGPQCGIALDVLVNNAAQTLTDSLASERKSVNRELKLLDSCSTGSLILESDSGYEARVRGGTIGLALEMKSMETEEIINDNIDFAAVDSMEIEEVVQQDNSVVPSIYPTKSSWGQTMDEVPYEDVITAHSVNTFVPFILCRELLSCMPSRSNLQDSPVTNENRRRPNAYIINVSSREGIFEDLPTSSAKNGHHVHTNMSKAALNMLTETEAAKVWRTHRIAMNSVDPGFMSAAPDFQNGDCPIGFDDGAGRVLWPVAVGEMKGELVWGRFLKHFGEVKVEVGKGR